MLGGVALTIGIGLQNFPEGLAVSMPLRREGMGKFKSFMYGQASGIVEPMAGVLGAWAVLSMQSVLPYALAFAVPRTASTRRRDSGWCCQWCRVQRRALAAAA